MLENYGEVKKYLTKLKDRPKMLLHVCCAPCSSHTVLLLNQYFDLTIFFSNDNIFPEEEYTVRFEELKRLIAELELSIEIINDTFQHERFLTAIEGHAEAGEKSIRCYHCYKLRMKRCALYAKENGFSFFTTSLSISPHKVTAWINEIGVSLENEFGVTYLYSDFKKENGYQNSIKLSKEFNLYRQEYCGCEFSKKEREVMKK